MKTLRLSLRASFACALLGAAAAFGAVQAAFYVDPVSGSNSNNGTAPGSAFATLDRARTAVRAINSSMTGDIIVNLMPGDHLMAAPLDLTQSDSGTNGHNVIWTSYGPRGSARLLGGVKVTGWTLDSGNIYKATVSLSGPRLQAIYENGVRGPLARHPNSGYWRVAAKDSTYPKKKFQWNSANSLPTVATPTDVQVFVWPGDRDWSTEIRDVASIGYANRWITLTMNIQQPYLGALDPGSRFFTQGANEFLDQPGEFYYDAGSSTLYYYPRSTPIANQEIVVPTTTTMFNLVATGATNLQARWQLENNVGDSSPFANDGETVNDPLYDTGPSGLGDALLLDGSTQYATVPHDDSLTLGAPATAFTITAWIKTSGTGLQPAVAKARPESTGVDIDYRLGLDENGKAQLYRWNADNSGGASSVTDADGTALNDGTWHHLAFVNESATSHKLYVDGALVETGTANWAYNDANAEPLEIGRYANVQGSSFTYFNGAIDDVRIYRSALGASGVAAIYNGTDSDQPLENIAITNLRFAATNLDYTNFNGTKQGMIYCENASNILIQNNEFTNIGGSAVNTSGGANLSIIGNTMIDAGIAGVTVRSATNSLVSNNRIHNTAQVFANAGSNITLSDSTGSEVSYNVLSKSKRQGISLRNANYNTVKYNEVFNMDEDSQDTGAVKWGYSDYNTFDHNRVHDSGDSFGQQHGMYVEDGSDHTTITNNIIYAIGNGPGNGLTAPINVKGVANQIENNIFDFSKSHAAVRTYEIASNAAARNEHLVRNILYASGSPDVLIDFQSYSTSRFAESDYNTFYKTSSGSYVVEGIPGDDTLANWKNIQSSKYDQHSITANPLFVDAANRDYRLQAGSPALGRGFIDIDARTVGLKPEFVYSDTRAQWIFSGNVNDITLHGNDGTLTGGSYVADWADVASSALNLNGTSAFVSVPHHAMLSFGAPSNPFTIVAWVKTSATAVGGIVSKGRATSTPSMDYRFRTLADGTVELSRFNVGAGVTESVASIVAINDGAWHHVAFVNEGAASHKLYVDGVLDTASTTTWTYNDANSEPVHLGRDRNVSTNAYFAGVLDDIAIIQRALTADEIKDLNHLPHN